jgi:hypothetical protein
MITRMQMPRQLRNKGGITNVSSRKKYGIGSDLKDFVRDIIPNELADVAVKVAPVVAPFYPGYAAIARGLGRFDQRGSISDALKQGAATYVGGRGVRALAGAEGAAGGFDTFSKKGFQERGLGKLFKGGKDTVLTEDQMKKKRLADLKNADSIKDTPGFMKTATEATIGKVPLLDKLPPMVQQKLLVGGVTAGASALYSYFTGEFEPQEPGETMGEYMARRNQRVKQQMRGYMDSYYTPLRNPQYAAMSDEEKNNFIDGIVGEQNDAMMATGGRVGYQTGGISSANTLAENIRMNQAAQQKFSESIAPTRENIRNQIASQSARSIAKNITASPKTTVGNYPKFLQMTPSNISQARSLTYPQAFALESQYKFDPKYVGADKTSRLGYFKQGLQSLAGIQQPGSNVGGATPLTRKLALDVGEKVLPTIAKGVTALTSLPASTALMTLNPTTANVDEANMTIEDFQNLYDSPEEQAAREADKARQAEIEAATPTPYEGLLSRLGQKDVDILVPGESFEDSQTRQKQEAMNTRAKINQEFEDYLNKQGYQKYLSDREIYQSAPAIMERENKLKEELNRLAGLDKNVRENFGFANILNDPNYRKQITGYTGPDMMTPTYRNLSSEELQNKLKGSLDQVYNQYGITSDQNYNYDENLTPGELSTLRNQLSDLEKYGNVDQEYLNRIDRFLPGTFDNLEDIQRRLDPNRTRFDMYDPSKRFDYGDVEFKQGYGLSLPSEFYKDILDRSQGLPSKFQGYGKNLLKQLQAMKSGGRVGLMGGAMPTGIMRSNQAGVMERDYRDEGGFVPVGIKEKADDVPAMLSKNEFVFTADAVRGAGNGSIEKGAQKMYDTMKNLERRVV